MNTLQGITILNTRAAHQAAPLTKALKKQGGSVIEIPLISILLPKDTSQIKQAMHTLHTYDWLVFTSANSVDFFIKQLKEEEIPLEKLERLMIAAVGEKTVQSIEKQGLCVDKMPHVYDGEHLTDCLVASIGKDERVLFPRSQLSRNTLTTALRKRRIHVDDPIMYETVYRKEEKEKLNELIHLNIVDIVTFTSPSTVHSFFQQLRQPGVKEAALDLRFAVIGSITAKALQDYGFIDMIIPDVFTVEGLVNKIIETTKK